MLLVAGADAAVGAVGGDDEVVALPIVEVGARLMLEMEIDAEFARPLLQDIEQALAADADEAVARRADAIAVDVDVDIVPMGELALDDLAADGIVGHQVLDRLVGEDDAPAERVVGQVALEQIDLVARIAQLHRYGEIQPSRTSAQARDPHQTLPPTALDLKGWKGGGKGPLFVPQRVDRVERGRAAGREIDRKSKRLNSSH